MSERFGGIIVLDIPVVHVKRDLHALLTDNFTTTRRICRKYVREKTSACVSLFVFFRIRIGTLPYSGGDDANTTKPNTNHA